MFSRTGVKFLLIYVCVQKDKLMNTSNDLIIGLIEIQEKDPLTLTPNEINKAYLLSSFSMRFDARINYFRIAVSKNPKIRK